jgi:serine/threonine protein kinase
LEEFFVICKIISVDDEQRDLDFRTVRSRLQDKGYKPDIVQQELQAKGYRLVGFIQFGGFLNGIILKVEKEGVYYAVKTYEREKLRDAEETMIRREAVSLGKHCWHPFIVTAKETFHTEKHVFMVLEFCEKGDMFEAVVNAIKIGKCKKTKVKEAAPYYIGVDSELVKRTMASLLLILDYFSSEGIVYRDLKPENVLLSGGGIKLTDFGFAKELRSAESGRRRRADSFCSTPLYAPHEALALSGEGILKKSVSYPVDIWSFGIVFAYLLFGRHPFMPCRLSEQTEIWEFHEEMKRTKTVPDYQYDKSKMTEVQKTAFDLIKGLLVYDPNKRLKLSAIKEHPYFRGVLWEKLGKFIDGYKYKQACRCVSKDVGVFDVDIIWGRRDSREGGFAFFRKTRIKDSFEHFDWNVFGADGMIVSDKDWSELEVVNLFGLGIYGKNSGTDSLSLSCILLDKLQLL